VKRDGFCVSNRELSVYYQSHFLCFYADTAFCVLLYVLTTFFRGNLTEENVKSQKDQCMAIFGHGCAHLFIGLEEQKGNFDDAFELNNKVILILLFFYGTFIRSVSSSLMRTIFSTVAVTAIHILYVPKHYAFTYVQTVFVLMATIEAMFKDKSTFYASSAIMVSLPIVTVPWIEYLACDDFLVHYGGHVWFDISIPAFMIIHIFYMKSHTSKQIKQE